MRIGCLGMATFDTLLFSDEKPPAHEAIVHVEETVTCLGGKGLVTAVAIDQSGAEARPFANLGERSELSAMLPADLERDHLLPVLDRDHRTWIAISGERQITTFVGHGRPCNGGEQRAIAALPRFLEGLDALYLTAEEPALLRATLDLVPPDLTIALNPTMPLLESVRQHSRLLFDLIHRANIVLCNNWEAPELLRQAGAEGWADLDAPSLGEVVVTAGAGGGTYAEAPFSKWEGFEAVLVPEVRCVVGAGDTFNGAYLTSRLGGASAAESSRRAAELAAVKVSHRGSTLPFD